VRAIISGISGDGWQEIADLTWPAMAEYARRHNVAFTPYYGRGDFSRPASWRKLIYIADCFAVADEVLWLDADVAVVDHLVNVFDEVPADAHVAMAYLAGTHWNCGVWLLRRPSLPMIMRAAMHDHCITHPWWEQQAVNEIIANHGVTPHRLGEEWNTWTGSSGVTPRFFHACGVTDRPSRLSLLKRHLC